MKKKPINDTVNIRIKIKTRNILKRLSGTYGKSLMVYLEEVADEKYREDKVELSKHA